MVTFDENTKVYLYPNEVSFRLGVQGLTTIIYESFHQKTFDNCLFVFFARSKSAVKIIEFDSNGVWMHVYKLNKAKYTSPQIDQNKTTVIDSRQLKLILESIREIHKRQNQPLKVEPSL